jgi:hypothetical protein
VGSTIWPCIKNNYQHQLRIHVDLLFFPCCSSSLWGKFTNFASFWIDLFPALFTADHIKLRCSTWRLKLTECLCHATIFLDVWGGFCNFFRKGQVILPARSSLATRQRLQKNGFGWPVTQSLPENFSSLSVLFDKDNDSNGAEFFQFH